MMKIFSDEDLTVDEQENIDSGKEQNLKRENTQNEQIKEMGQVVLDSNSRKHKVELLTIIGEVEGHESAPSHSKTTKYEHVLPKLAIIEDDEEIEGLADLAEYSRGRCGSWACHCRDDRIIKHSYGITGSGRRTFHRSSHGCFSRLFLCSPKCDYGDPSGTFQWYVYRSDTDIPEYGKNSGSYHNIYLRTFQSIPAAPGGTDAGYHAAGKRCGNDAGRKRSGEGKGLIDEVGGIKEALAKLYELIEKHDHK